MCEVPVAGENVSTIGAALTSQPDQETALSREIWIKSMTLTLRLHSVKTVDSSLDAAIKTLILLYYSLLNKTFNFFVFIYEMDTTSCGVEEIFGLFFHC